MFRIGEISKIAQVPGSLLRYYDQIGLLKPAHIDQWTGYRYYSAKQLQRLHRILALKELGLTLEQITWLVEEEVSAAEIRGMLTLKKAQVEQTVQEEIRSNVAQAVVAGERDPKAAGWDRRLLANSVIFSFGALYQFRALIPETLNIRIGL